jgi:hypothetical protein
MDSPLGLGALMECGAMTALGMIVMLMLVLPKTPKTCAT